MSARRSRKVHSGQITFMPEECPECEGITGEPTGLEYDQRTQTTYEGWRCSCGTAVRLLVSGKLA
jgi:hypothetical protein